MFEAAPTKPSNVEAAKIPRTTTAVQQQQPFGSSYGHHMTSAAVPADTNVTPSSSNNPTPTAAAVPPAAAAAAVQQPQQFAQYPPASLAMTAAPLKSPQFQQSGSAFPDAYASPRYHHGYGNQHVQVASIPQSQEYHSRQHHGYYSGALGDLDGDGDLDIVGVRDYSKGKPIQIYRNLLKK